MPLSRVDRALYRALLPLAAKFDAHPRLRLLLKNIDPILSHIPRRRRNDVVDASRGDHPLSSLLSSSSQENLSVTGSASLLERFLGKPLIARTKKEINSSSIHMESMFYIPPASSSSAVEFLRQEFRRSPSFSSSLSGATTPITPTAREVQLQQENRRQDVSFALLRFLNERLSIADRVGWLPKTIGIIPTTTTTTTTTNNSETRPSQDTTKNSSTSSIQKGMHYSDIRQAVLNIHQLNSSSFSSTYTNSSLSPPTSKSSFPFQKNLSKVATTIKAGTLLVSHPFLDYPFDRKVILVLEHDPLKGTLGVVINSSASEGEVSRFASSYTTTTLKSKALLSTSTNSSNNNSARADRDGNKILKRHEHDNDGGSDDDKKAGSGSGSGSSGGTKTDSPSNNNSDTRSNSNNNTNEGDTFYTERIKRGRSRGGGGTRRANVHGAHVHEEICNPISSSSDEIVIIAQPSQLHSPSIRVYVNGRDVLRGLQRSSCGSNTSSISRTIHPFVIPAAADSRSDDGELVPLIEFHEKYQQQQQQDNARPSTSFLFPLKDNDSIVLDTSLMTDRDETRNSSSSSLTTTIHNEHEDNEWLRDLELELLRATIARRFQQHPQSNKDTDFSFGGVKKLTSSDLVPAFASPIAAVINSINPSLTSSSNSSSSTLPHHHHHHHHESLNLDPTGPEPDIEDIASDKDTDTFGATPLHAERMNTARRLEDPQGGMHELIECTVSENEKEEVEPRTKTQPNQEESVTNENSLVQNSFSSQSFSTSSSSDTDNADTDWKAFWSLRPAVLSRAGLSHVLLGRLRASGIAAVDSDAPSFKNLDDDDIDNDNDNDVDQRGVVAAAVDLSEMKTPHDLNRSTSNNVGESEIFLQDKEALEGTAIPEDDTAVSHHDAFQPRIIFTSLHGGSTIAIHMPPLGPGLDMPNPISLEAEQDKWVKEHEDNGSSSFSAAPLLFHWHHAPVSFVDTWTGKVIGENISSLDSGSDAEEGETVDVDEDRDDRGNRSNNDDGPSVANIAFHIIKERKASSSSFSSVPLPQPSGTQISTLRSENHQKTNEKGTINEGKGIETELQKLSASASTSEDGNAVSMHDEENDDDDEEKENDDDDDLTLDEDEQAFLRHEASTNTTSSFERSLVRKLRRILAEDKKHTQKAKKYSTQREDVDGGGNSSLAAVLEVPLSNMRKTSTMTTTSADHLVKDKFEDEDHQAPTIKTAQINAAKQTSLWSTIKIVDGIRSMIIVKTLSSSNSTSSSSSRLPVASSASAVFSSHESDDLSMSTTTTTSGIEEMPSAIAIVVPLQDTMPPIATPLDSDGAGVADLASSTPESPRKLRLVTLGNASHIPVHEIHALSAELVKEWFRIVVRSSGSSSSSSGVGYSHRKGDSSVRTSAGGIVGGGGGKGGGSSTSRGITGSTGGSRKDHDNDDGDGTYNNININRPKKDTTSPTTRNNDNNTNDPGKVFSNSKVFSGGPVPGYWLVLHPYSEIGRYEIAFDRDNNEYLTVGSEGNLAPSPLKAVARADDDEDGEKEKAKPTGRSGKRNKKKFLSSHPKQKEQQEKGPQSLEQPEYQENISPGQHPPSIFVCRDMRDAARLVNLGRLLSSSPSSSATSIDGSAPPPLTTTTASTASENTAVSDFVFFQNASKWRSGQLARELEEGTWIAIEHAKVWNLVRDHSVKIAQLETEIKKEKEEEAKTGRKKVSPSPSPWKQREQTAQREEVKTEVESEMFPGDEMWSSVLDSLGGEYRDIAKVPRL